jgi:ribonucleoside-triphosphate reductase
MYIRVTYDAEFDDLMMYLRSKYPQKLFDLDGIGEQTDMSKFSKKFFASNTTADASIDANANVDDVSVIAYNTELPKPFFRLNSYYILWKELRRLYGLLQANTIIEKQLIGDIYIHDFHGVAAGIPYCFNYSTYDIMTKGLPMVKKIKSIQPKYLYSFKSQLEQFVVIASNSTLGATGLADLLITMSYYVSQILKNKKDAHFTFATENDCWNYIKETLVSFIYTINQPMRANQSPFTNVSVYDKYFLEEFSKDYIFPDGSLPDLSVINELQELYLRVMNEEMERTPVTFPITTACFSIDVEGNIMDKEFKHIIAFYNQKFGFINIYNGSTSTLSSCCRLRSNKDNEYFNSFGSGSSKIGSLGVCTINLPRLAFLADGDINKFKSGLTDSIEICAKVNNAKRHVIRKRLENGNLPLYSLGFLDINKQYSTVGVNGFYEAIKILGNDILTEDGRRLGLEIINTINEANDKFEKQYSAPHNCEQVPAENVAIKLASKDKLLKIQDEYDIYSNQFIPLTTKANMLDRIYLQGKFDSEFSGGAICHINIDTPIDDVSKIEDLIESSAKNGVVYWAINYNLQQCENGHMTVGKKELCSICGKKITDNYTRVVGFLTNTKNWHQVRREQDYPNRQFYSET